MYPAQFEYDRADSVAEAIDLLGEHADREVEVLAGGHSLLPTMKTGLASPDVLIDIDQIDVLQGIDAEIDRVTIGALTRYADVAMDDTVQNYATVFAEAAGEIGDVQVRNRGTVGGNLAHADPASDLPAAAVAADATVVAHGPNGERTIDIDEFFRGMYTTALGDAELLTRIELPALGEHDVDAYVKKPSPSSGYALIGVATRLRTDGETIESARVAANGAMDHAVRLDSVEDALAGEPIDEDVFAAAVDGAADPLDETLMMDDIHASSEFRAQLLDVYTERALHQAADRL